jgi:hypothetical protein
MHILIDNPPDAGEPVFTFHRYILTIGKASNLMFYVPMDVVSKAMFLGMKRKPSSPTCTAGTRTTPSTVLHWAHQRRCDNSWVTVSVSLCICL